MAMFNSYVELPEDNICFSLIQMIIAPALQSAASDVQEELVQDVPGVPKALYWGRGFQL